MKSTPMYDYKNQAWVIAGLYQRCNHPAEMECQCYGRLHAGEPADMDRLQRDKIRNLLLQLTTPEQCDGLYKQLQADQAPLWMLGMVSGRYIELQKERATLQEAI